MFSLITPQKQNMLVLMPLLDSGTCPRFWKQIVLNAGLWRKSPLIQHIARKAGSLYSELKWPGWLPGQRKSGCGERSTRLLAHSESRAGSGALFSTQQRGTSPRGLSLTSFVLYQFFHQICAWIVSFTPWKMLKARLKCAYLCWLRIWGYHGVYGTFSEYGSCTWCQSDRSIQRGRRELWAAG